MYQAINITFKDAVAAWAHKLFCFKGRARRAEYWYPYIMFYIFTLIGNALLNTGAIKSVGLLMAFFAVEFIGILLFLPVAVRRLHDIGLSGLWSILGYLPVAACIPLLINPQRFFQYIVMQIAFPGDNTLFWTICICSSTEKKNRTNTATRQNMFSQPMPTSLQPKRQELSTIRITNITLTEKWKKTT